MFKPAMVEVQEMLITALFEVSIQTTILVKLEEVYLIGVG